MPSINGIYTRASQTANGHSYYTKGSGAATRVLYWQPQDGGKWILADEVGKSIRAVQPDNSSPTFGPPPTSGWVVRRLGLLNNDWVQENIDVSIGFKKTSNDNFCLEYLGDGADHEAVMTALRTFDVANAKCYDPVDLANIRMLVNACGVRQFNEMIRDLAVRFSPPRDEAV